MEEMPIRRYYANRYNFSFDDYIVKKFIID